MVRRTVVLLLSSFDAIPQTARVGIFPLHLDPPTIYHQEIFRALVGDGMGSDWQSAHQSARDEAARHTAPHSNLTPGSSAALSREELVQNLREAVFSSEYAPFDHLIVLPNTRFPITIQQARHLAAMSTLSCKNLAGNKLDVEEVERDTQAALQHAMSIFPPDGSTTTTSASGIISPSSSANPLQDIPYLKNTRRRTRSVSQVLASSTLLTPAEINQWAPADSPLLNPQQDGSQLELDEEDHYFRPSLSPTPDFQSGFGDRPAVATSHSPVGSGGPPGGYVPEVAGTVRRRKARSADGAQIPSPGIASASHHANIYRRVHMELYSLEHPDVHMPLVQRLVQRFPNAAIVHWLPNVFETHQWRGYTKLFEQVPFLLLRPRGFHFGASTTMAHFENAATNKGSGEGGSSASPNHDGPKEPLPSSGASTSTATTDGSTKKKSFPEIKGMSREESIHAAKTFSDAMSVSKYLRPNNAPSTGGGGGDLPAYTSRLSHRGLNSSSSGSRNATWAAAVAAIAAGDSFENMDELIKALSSSSSNAEEGKKKSYRVPRPEKLEIIEVDRLSGVRVRQLLWDRGSSDVIQEQDGTVRGRSVKGSGGRSGNPILGERAAGVGARSSPSSSTVVPDDGSSIIPQAVLRYMNSHGLYRDFRKGDQSNAGMDTMAMAGPHAGGTAGAGGSSSSATGGNSGGAGRSPSLAFHATVAFSSVIPRLELHYDPLNKMAREQYEMLKPYEVRPGKEPDLIVPIGGDGFMMHCIRRQWERFIPFFGVNAGHVGFLLNDSGTLEELFTAPLRLHHMSMLYVQAETEVEEESELAAPHDTATPEPTRATPSACPEEDASAGGSLLARNVAKIQAEAAAARQQPFHQLPAQKPLGPKKRVVERREELAFNDAWVERSGGQSALIRLLINGSEKIRAVRGDGVLVSTAAGSTAYAQALGASPFPVDVPLLQLVGSNVVSPPRWRPVHLSEDDSVELQVIDSFKRPCRGFVDSVEIGNVTKFKIKTSRVASVQLAFCGSCDLQHKLYQLQFPKGF